MATDGRPIHKAVEVVRWFLSDDGLISAWPRIEEMDADEAREKLFATAELAGLLLERLAAAAATDKAEWFKEYVKTFRLR
jgi:hypothetical protein